jgi:hypothetical protein
MGDCGVFQGFVYCAAGYGWAVENEAKCQRLAERRNYVELVRKAEEARQLDDNLSPESGICNEGLP